MNNVNKTLYIPLYGKALVSKKGIILRDEKAEEIWAQAQFPLKGKSKSKWLAYYLGMRSAVFDEWVKVQLRQAPKATVLHLGCGLDSRVERVGACFSQWIDVDFPAVIDERKRYYKETEAYRMLAADIKESAFTEAIQKGERAIVIMEGVSMYLTNADLQQTLARITAHFKSVVLLVDCYTSFAAKMSKIKNPVKDVGVSKVYGVKRPDVLEDNTGLTFLKEHEITPKYLVNELHGFEKFVFRCLYAGRTAKRLYKLYEYKSEVME